MFNFTLNDDDSSDSYVEIIRFYFHLNFWTFISFRVILNLSIGYEIITCGTSLEV